MEKVAICWLRSTMMKGRDDSCLLDAEVCGFEYFQRFGG